MPHASVQPTKVQADLSQLWVDSGFPNTEAWLAVGGLIDLRIEQGVQREDTGGLTDQVSHIVTDRSLVYVATCFRLVDSTGLGADPGQGELSALGEAVWSASVGRVKVVLPGGTTRVFRCTADVLDPAGSIDGFQTWQARLYVASDYET